MSPLARTVLLSAWLAAAPAAAATPAVADAWIRATPPGARTAAAYLTLTSTGAFDRLLGAATDAAASVEIHTSIAAGGVTRMERLAELAVPPRATVRLEPGGAHLMLIGLAAPLAPGARVRLSLQFATGSVELEVPVVDARTNAHGH
jgi:copper(I)-binding protein